MPKQCRGASTERCLTLLLFLRESRKRFSIVELCAQFGCNRKTMIRDLHILERVDPKVTLAMCPNLQGEHLWDRYEIFYRRNL
jgi:predicted DNA-binding transcriptional regulator YafY